MEEEEEVALAKTKLELLIIEDNQEMRDFIRHCIRNEKYNIREAADGAIGIQMAMEQIPDLIISDIMMPEKDGYEVTKAIRFNISTSHIPLILLTAKTSLDSRLKALKRGADVYLTKPFSPKELRLRIWKLIESRRLLQQRFQSNSKATYDAPVFAFEQEDNFIKEVKTIIHDKIDSPELNGQFIGKALGLSRMHLYRKLKAITNQSASEFIREYRLQQAFQLLKAGKGNVSEITYQTGFSSPAYFSQIFKKKFGKAPSEFINS